MGRLTQGHFDDVFLNKIKQACIHVLDQLNEANEIEQAFDLCPSITRRNRAILSFLRDADQVSATASSSSSGSTAVAQTTSTSSAFPTLRPSSSLLPSRESSLGMESVTSLSARRRRRAREMQYVRDPNDSNDDSDSQATVGPSASRTVHLDPASARNPTMSQPDYTFEQFADHLDPADRLLKRSLEIIIKETARQALARKRDGNHDSISPSTNPPADASASLRSAILSSQVHRSSQFDPYRDSYRNSYRRSTTDWSPEISNPRISTRDLPDRLLRSLGSSSNAFAIGSEGGGSRSDRTTLSTPRTLRDLVRTGRGGILGPGSDLPSTSTDSSSFTARPTRRSGASSSAPNVVDRIVVNQDAEPSSILPDNLMPQLAQRRSAARSASTLRISSQAISARLAEASRYNAEAAITIGEAERLRSSQFIRTSIESLRASLFQLHLDLASTQLQNDHHDTSQPNTDPHVRDIGPSYALVMDTIELFDDTLRRLSCLVANTNRQGESHSHQNGGSSQMRTSLWRARNLLLLSSMAHRPHQSEEAQAHAQTSSAGSRDAECRAHRHLLATMEESHWARPDVQAPSSDSIRAWRRKLAAWYYLDRDRARYPDAPRLAGDHEEPHVRWHPDLELPYALDDEIMAPMASDPASTRPDPIANPQAAWAYARTHDVSLHDDLNQDAEVLAALAAGPVISALEQWLTLRGDSESTTDPANEARQREAAANPTELAPSTAEVEVDPDVSLTRTTSLSRRNAVRGLPLTNSDASSMRSARSSLSLRRGREPSRLASQLPQSRSAALSREDNDAVEEDIVETSIEIGTVPHSPEAWADSAAPSQQNTTHEPESSLALPPDCPRHGRSGSFTFISTPAAVLRSRQRSQSRGQGGPRSQSPAAAPIDEDDPLDEDDADAEEFIDLDLDLGMTGEDAFDFDLVDFLRSESRRTARLGNDDDAESDFADASPPRLRRTGDDDSDVSESASPTGVRVFVSGSGASTPAEARQATFEAYAQRARLLERRRRMERQGQSQDEDADDHAEAPVGGGNGSQVPSPESRRRRRGRDLGGSSTSAEESRRNSLPFPRASER